MSELEVIDVESTELVVREPAPANLFRSDDPNEIIERASQTASALSRVLREQKLTTSISGREHVRVEGWTLLGSMLGVFPVCVWTRKLEDGWEARVEAKTLSGAIVGAAEAECLRSEKEWGPNPTKGKPKDDYALRSMAQTRATSKALRQPLGFVVTLAGFDVTPAEEMPRESAPEDPDEEAKEAAFLKAVESARVPSEMPLHFGKNRRTLLGELTPAQLRWYANEWKLQDEPTEYDHRLKAAAVALALGDNSPIESDPYPDVPFS